MAVVDDFRREQRRVAAGMALALLITAITLGFAAFLEPAARPVKPVAERLQVALRADVFVILWLAAAIANVARRRFFSPDDIAGSGAGPGSKPVRDGVAILQNTFEQVGLALPTHLAFAAVMERPAAMLTALAVLFCIGRALFWAGFSRGAGARALGFALTFYPTLAALALSAATLVLGGSTERSAPPVSRAGRPPMVAAPARSDASHSHLSEKPPEGCDRDNETSVMAV